MKHAHDIVFIDKACLKEYESLSDNQKLLIDKGVARLRVRANELGKPLSGDLSGCKELKYRSDGLRIIFRIKENKIEIVEIIAIGKRDKDKVFKSAKMHIARNI